MELEEYGLFIGEGRSLKQSDRVTPCSLSSVIEKTTNEHGVLILHQVGFGLNIRGFHPYWSNRFEPWQMVTPI